MVETGINKQFKLLPTLAKVLTGLLLAFLLLLFAGSIYLHKVISRRLREVVHKASNELYHLQYSKVKLNLFTGKLSVYDFKLSIDTNTYKKLRIRHKAPRFVIAGEVKVLTLKNLHWLRYFNSGSIQADKLIINAPALNLTQYKANGKDTIPNRPASLNEMFLSELKGLRLGSFEITNAIVNYQYADGIGNERPVCKFENFNFKVEDLVVQKNQDAVNKISFSNYSISLKNYKHLTTDSMYTMELNNFQYNSRSNKASIASFAIQPQFSEEDYSLRMPFQKMRNDLKIQNVNFYDVDISSLIDSGDIRIKKIVVGNGSWHMYLSRIPPLPAARKKVVPAQQLLELPLRLNIAVVEVQRFQLRYKEFNPSTDMPGLVNFNDLNGTISNITNSSGDISNNPHLKASFASRLMGQGSFKADFDFLLNDSSGKFTVKAQLDSMDATALNPGFIPLNKIEITKGTIRQMNCSGSGNENITKGDIELLYNDLHIAVWGKDKKADTLKNKAFTSLIANILIKNDNPKEHEPTRTAHNILIKRAPPRSYFNMLWMILFTGIGKIVVGK